MQDDKIPWYGWVGIILISPIFITILAIRSIWDKADRQTLMDLRDEIFFFSQAWRLLPRDFQARRKLKKLITERGGALHLLRVEVKGNVTRSTYVINHNSVSIKDIADLCTYVKRPNRWVTPSEYMLTIALYVVNEERHYLCNLCCVPKVKDRAEFDRLSREIGRWYR